MTIELLSLDDTLSWLKKNVKGEIHTDSRLIQKGDGFIAWPGLGNDARQHIFHAQANGASVCLIEREGLNSNDIWGDDVGTYLGLQEVCGNLVSDFYKTPSARLKLVAITGTNGKTSTAWWLAQALTNLRLANPISCAMVGTLGIGLVSPLGNASNDIPKSLIPTGLTTPDPIVLQRNLNNFVKKGILACALEASSIGLEELRLKGTHIHTAVITNFSQDHLDYHNDMASYWLAKSNMFDMLGIKAVVINTDTPQCQSLAMKMNGRGVEIWTVSINHPAHLQGVNITYTEEGLRFDVIESIDGNRVILPVQTQILGSYNVENLLVVIGAMRSLGVNLNAAVEVCQRLASVPGRMNFIREERTPLAVVDYAHTPDALRNVLIALQPVTKKRGGRLWCVFGCGGSRDSMKRPMMGAIASQYADQVIVTSDNPRNEEENSIIAQILQGVKGQSNVRVVVERRNAIEVVFQNAQEQDVILIAGKGHEAYQEVKGKKILFSDFSHVQAELGKKKVI